MRRRLVRRLEWCADSDSDAGTAVHTYSDASTHANPNADIVAHTDSHPRTHTNFHADIGNGRCDRRRNGNGHNWNHVCICSRHLPIHA
jgi:hypothetical protein